MNSLVKNNRKSSKEMHLYFFFMS